MHAMNRRIKLENDKKKVMHTGSIVLETLDGDQAALENLIEIKQIFLTQKTV